MLNVYYGCFIDLKQLLIMLQSIHSVVNGRDHIVSTFNCRRWYI